MIAGITRGDLVRGDLVRIIASPDELRNTPLEAVCPGATQQQLLDECDELNRFRASSGSLYERVRALLFLSSIHRYFLPPKLPHDVAGLVPWDGYTHLLNRRYEEAAERFLAVQRTDGPSETISSALAAAYRGLAFQTLADQVRRSVRSVRGNQWMFRVGHYADHPLRIRRELLQPENGLYPVVFEATPVRMDLTHSGWSDIFFLGMDFPEGARVLNVSIDLAVRSGAGAAAPKPPVEAYFRIIDQPVLRLVSVDLHAQTDVSSLTDLFDFAADYLGLLKAAVIASGLIPPGLEGSGQSMASVLEQLTGSAGLGIEIVSKVNDIPKGSRLAVSTNLLACLISACMRATGQIASLDGGITEAERRIVAARAILGEWLGGSGGGWQDSGGVWPGIKIIEGVAASPADVEFGVSRGCLLPRHRILDENEVTPATREALQNSLVLAHGGMAQDVGPILEMVTEKYLLRSAREWKARGEAMGILDEIVRCLRTGDIRGIGAATQRNFDGPVQTIIPWAGNSYTHSLIRQVREKWGDQFWGFWMLGGMAGGGMGFIFAPEVRAEAQTALADIMLQTRRRLGSAVPFAMDPVVYDFAINPRGTSAKLLRGRDAMLPGSYYTMVVPGLLRQEARALSPARRAELEHFGSACHNRPEMADTASALIEYLLPRNAEETGGKPAASLDDLLDACGFDRAQHEKIRADLRAGRIGLAQNALPASTLIENVRETDVVDLRGGAPPHLVSLGERALRNGEVAVVSLAGGIGTRWTRGAGVVKALNPFCQLGGAWRTFIDIHLAKSRRSARLFDAAVPHVITTSYLTHEPIERCIRGGNAAYSSGPLYLSPGRSVGLRLIPMVRDLRFLWEEMPQQALDEQKQKARESLRAALMQWARQTGEGADYRDNAPAQCLHPVGHWYELPNMLLNGVLARLLAENPQVRHLLLHNIDTLGATLDAGMLGAHLEGRGMMTVEVIPRVVDDRGGGLARVNGRPRLLEGLALPQEDLEFQLSWYNSNSMWIDVDRLLEVFGLTRASLRDPLAVAAAVRRMAARVPTYVTIKDVRKRWGRGQEDIFPVTQFEKLWGDMTALPEVETRFAAVPRLRGQQLKDVAQLDGWWRDGSAESISRLCDWAP